MPHLDMAWGLLGLGWGVMIKVGGLVLAPWSRGSGCFFGFVWGFFFGSVWFFTKRPWGLRIEAQSQPCDPPGPCHRVCQHLGAGEEVGWKLFVGLPLF